VLATNGVRTGADASDGTFVVAPQSSQVYILFPREGQRVTLEEPLTLVGYAFDPEDGILSGESLNRTLGNSVRIGIGTHAVTTLPTGRQTIILTATDSQGNRTSVSIEIWVGFDVYLPMVTRNE